jgi:hypothetical protein
MRERREMGAARRLFKDLPQWFLPSCKFFYLNTNLSRTRGSIQEAIRRTVALPKCPNAVMGRLSSICIESGWQPGNGEKLPTCPPDLAESILARAQTRKRIMPDSITKHIAVAAPFVRFHRNKRDATLDYISAWGSQMWQEDEAGEKHFIQGGDLVECDDSTVNFPVVVPWQIRGCPCSEKYGVKVGRWQWLVAIDVGSRKILGFTYTARPKSAYRGEDVLALLRCVVRQHGVPRAWRLEKGVWASNLVTNAVDLMGARRIAVHSPHSKPFIEGLFNTLWTRLSCHFPDASVGRFRGEGGDASRVLAACIAGERDPRPHFPILTDAVAAFEEVCADHNNHIVDSENYGRWVPDERWAADVQARPLRRLEPETDFLFSPFVRTWTVRGNSVGGRVPIFDSLGVPFMFSAPWLLPLHGARVKCYFDPNIPQCSATVVLDQAAGTRRPGEVLGVAALANETTAYVQSVLGHGADGRGRGIQELRQAATALRRVVRGVLGGPVAKASVEMKYQEWELRDGVGGLSKVVQGTESTDASAEAVPAPPVPVDFTTRLGKVARLPLAVREELNSRLRDGEVANSLLLWLNGLAAVKEILRREFKSSPLSAQNVSNWKNGAYRHWLQVQTASEQQDKPGGRRATIHPTALQTLA